MLDLLAFGAHPDDVEVMIGGIMLKMADKGHSLGIIDLTTGGASTYGTVEERQAEVQAAAKLLNLKVRENLGFEDCNIINDFEARAKVIRALRVHRPRVVLAPHRDCIHPDMVKASTTIEEAIFYSGLKNIEPDLEPFRPEAIYFYFSQSGRYIRSFKPTFVVDTTPYFERKLQLLFTFKSQYGDPTREKGPDFFERIIRTLDSHFGSLIGVPYGEPLVVKDPVRINDPLRVAGTGDR